MPSAHLQFDESADKIARRVKGMRSSAVRDLFAAATRSDIISLSGGMPDVSLLPPEHLRTAVEAAIAPENVAVSLQYGGTAGTQDIRQVFCDVMRDIGIRCKPEGVLVTSGAQQAIDLISKAFIDPGDIIITEGPTYLGTLQAFSAYEPDIRCIPFDEDGMRMDLLEQELEKLGRGKVKLLYTIPNFQNPGGVTMSPERRKRLIELSEEYDFLVIEDDPYGRLRYEGGHLIPLKVLSDKVIYLGTISKIFAPGLRMGWIAAPEYILKRINLVKQGSDLCGSSFDQMVVAHYFNDTPWEKTLQRFISTYAERRDAMLAAMDEYFPAEASWTHPVGGFFVWVTLPDYVDTSAMLALALERGVTYTPGDGFFPDGKRGRNCMRVAFCFESPDNIREAIQRLADVIEDQLELYRVFLDAGAIKEA